MSDLGLGILKSAGSQNENLKLFQGLLDLEFQRERADFHRSQLNDKGDIADWATPHWSWKTSIISFNLPSHLLHLRLLLVC